jgi:hypothetical protein
MTILRTLTIKAKKRHRCNFCQKFVEPKTIYTRTSIACDGTVYEWVSHRHCDALFEKLKMDEHNDYQGVDVDDFHSYVTEEYKSIQKNANSSFDYKAKIDFIEALTVVCNHYGIELN